MQHVKGEGGWEEGCGCEENGKEVKLAHRYYIHLWLAMQILKLRSQIGRFHTTMIYYICLTF